MPSQNSSVSFNYESICELLQTNLPLFRQEAEYCDKTNTFPVNNFEFLKDNQFLALLVPTQYGGLGLNFKQYQHIITIIAKGCPATASAFNMHSLIIGGLAEVVDNHANRSLLRHAKKFIEHIFSLVVDDKKVFASLTTEPHNGSRISKTATTYEKTNEGYYINGTKSFVTMAGYADYYMVLANKKVPALATPELADNLSYFIIERTTPGISVINNWDTLGMRGTQSYQINFSNVYVAKDQVFLNIIGFALNKVYSAPHWFIGAYLGVYLGIMEASLEFTISYLKNHSDQQNKTGLAYEKLIQARLARIYVLYHTAKLAIENAADLVLNEPNAETTRRAMYSAKYIVGENCILLTSEAIKTCGGSTISKTFALERLFRDSRCCALMPAVSDVCELYIGQSLLEIDKNSLW